MSQQLLNKSNFFPEKREATRIKHGQTYEADREYLRMIVNVSKSYENKDNPLQSVMDDFNKGVLWDNQNHPVWSDIKEDMFKLIQGRVRLLNRSKQLGLGVNIEQWPNNPIPPKLPRLVETIRDKQGRIRGWSVLSPMLRREIVSA